MATEKPSTEVPSKSFIACDLCGVEAEIPENSLSTRCKNKNCTAGGNLILAPLTENKRYIRFLCFCKTTLQYAWTYNNQTSYRCQTPACDRDNIITDDVVEIRSKQTVYNSYQKERSAFDEFIDIKEKLKKSEEEVERLRNQVKEFEVETNKMQRENLKNVEDVYKSKEDQMKNNVKTERLLRELEACKLEKKEMSTTIKFLEAMLEEKREEIKEKKGEIKEMKEDIKTLRKMAHKKETR